MPSHWQVCAGGVGQCPVTGRCLPGASDNAPSQAGVNWVGGSDDAPSQLGSILVLIYPNKLLVFNVIIPRNSTANLQISNLQISIGRQTHKFASSNGCRIFITQVSPV